MGLTPAEKACCRRLLELAFEEDVGGKGDLTSLAVIPAERNGQAVFRARAPGILAGLPCLKLLFETADVRVEALLKDGAPLETGSGMARVSGSMREILAGERIGLNFMQHLSGIASKTHQYVKAVAPYNCRILDTRKTLPGWRLLEKYAVRQGGGANHRIGLHDGVLIKDNHLAALGNGLQSVASAVAACRAKYGHAVPLTVEVENLDQFDVALESGPDVILLDNMATECMAEAVRRRVAAGLGVLLEASGGVTLSTVGKIAATGVDRISVGEITHSAPALDMALDYETA